MATTTYYTQAVLQFVTSENSDYTSPAMYNTPFSYTTTAPAQFVTYTKACTTSGTTIELSNFASVLGVVVRNKDTANYVDVAWTYSATASKAKVPAGAWMFIPTPVTIANDLTITANTATVDCDLIIIGT